ncbi:threonine--tRNA ligase [Halobacillus sp. ACCC02827]|uniref:threonine--tRNA ligase n=1 Tax=Halobacillus sp. ACCC02827 TaxID=3052090 RepID=UPI00257075E0|nr:threonine--tRNA ligase [Halobacillus sp. ACCC02827]WJE17225.1 threonine--tRNA ligase [Halobacillus sp. ACCC02827]
MKHSNVEIVFPDGKKKEFESGITLEGIADSISPSLKKRSVGGTVNGELYDYRRPIVEDAAIELLDSKSEAFVKMMRHTAAHVLAQAIRRLYGDVHLGIGPVTENGFFYDIDMDHMLTKEDLPVIEKEMKKIIEENYPVTRESMTREEADALFAGDPYKEQLIDRVPDDEGISIYRQGEFVDLCRGPHVPSTKWVGAFVLTNVAGAYWQGDKEKPMMQRVYGKAFPTKAELDEHSALLEEAERRSHRKLGKELNLFFFSEEAPGMPFYTKNGQIIRNELEGFLRGLQEAHDYEEVRTPLMMNQRLWKQSGHWHHYKENMYFSEVDDQTFAMKPMNCPGHMLIFKNQLHSYRDLPIRMSEFGQVHRHEYSGALNGLLRVRSFCQDDAHIFVRPDQVEDEIASALRLIDEVYRTFGFEYTVELSTRPEKSMGEDAMWNQAEEALKSVLDRLPNDYVINEGDGAFYGPKIDIHIKDALQRSHQCATVQLDFQMPEKFDLTYVDETGAKVRPVVLHRAVFGSIDRFLGILIEHFAGAFPVWLAPEQVKVLPVSPIAHEAYAGRVIEHLKRSGIRAGVDAREEKLGYRMRNAQMSKTPYIIVVGDEERDNHSLNVRIYGQKESETVSLEAFLQKVTKLIGNRVLSY